MTRSAQRVAGERLALLFESGERWVDDFDASRARGSGEQISDDIGRFARFKEHQGAREFIQRLKRNRLGLTQRSRDHVQ